MGVSGESSIIANSKTEEPLTSSSWRGTLLVAAASALVFGLLFNHESSLSYSIGYNLYGAERILGGDVPYRDFHTLYPPATVYLNAALFRVFGVGLYTALAGVCAFKILTVAAIYACSRKVMPPAWSLLASVYGLTWLRPNGPFKAVPMHYGALFLALGLYFLLAFLAKNRTRDLLLCGVSLGILALFKHNIAAYAVFGSLAVLTVGRKGFADIRTSFKERFPSLLWLLAGCGVPVIPVLIYMLWERALGGMLRTLFLGPGEFLLRRLAATPSPVVPALGLCVIVIGCIAAHRISSSRPGLSLVVLSGSLLLISAFCCFAPESRFSEVAFYSPLVVLLCAVLVWWKADRLGVTDRGPLLAVAVTGWAALMESFPRFAREQAIASGPFVGLLAVYLAYLLWPAARRYWNLKWQAIFSLSILPLLFLSLGSRIFFQTFFRHGFHLSGNTELAIDRGRGVYFPQSAADEINSVVQFIQEKVPEGGYVFAQSYAGSSYLFLSARRNPSPIQFWGGVGVTEQEKQQTMTDLLQKGVGLVVTNRTDMENETYRPLREYLMSNFRVAREFGNVTILVRSR